MKSVSGKLTSTKPISLSKAARILSAFISKADDAASRSVSVYLRRTSAAFDELVNLHKELRGSHSSENRHHLVNVKRKQPMNLEQNPPDSEDTNSRKRKKHRSVDVKKEYPVKIEQNSQEVEEVVVKHGKQRYGNLKDEKPNKFEENGEIGGGGFEHVQVSGRKRDKKKNIKGKGMEMGCGIGFGIYQEEKEVKMKESAKRKSREFDEEEHGGLKYKEKRRKVRGSD